MSIQFISEQIDFQLNKPDGYSIWLDTVFKRYGREYSDIQFIFCSDEYLLGLNKKYLGHDTYTDIITFPNHDDDQPILADIFISIDRVKDNAAHLGLSFMEELKRVMVHGVLHLAGFNDKTEGEKLQMRKLESEFIGLFELE